MPSQLLQHTIFIGSLWIVLAILSIPVSKIMRLRKLRILQLFVFVSISTNCTGLAAAIILDEPCDRNTFLGVFEWSITFGTFITIMLVGLMSQDPGRSWSSRQLRKYF